MNKIKKRLRSKTYWAVIGGVLLTAIEVNGAYFSQLLPAPLRPLTLMFWPVLMIGLREATKTPVSEK